MKVKEEINKYSIIILKLSWIIGLSSLILSNWFFKKVLLLFATVCIFLFFSSIFIASLFGNLSSYIYSLYKKNAKTPRLFDIFFKIIVFVVYIIYLIILLT